MNIEEIRAYCLSKPFTTEGFPFGEDTLVFKVHGKMYALANLTKGHSINLKCEPERAVHLREMHSEIIPGYHMNKKHWNTINTEGLLSVDLLKELIDHSYDLVWGSLPKRLRDNS
ncbi:MULTISPECIES: MmcQ/YjbR family DNA-binding protein [unclassified Lentimicrobium]|uniref:MmcQ/YjbR family DNA-binding protein n=1 Tax=unclassified Lentimicrobium TaxID=2677434 RepID=UPI00155349FC|nr:MULTISPECIES: MmcQ/YjbR family DNA-binding protein [unclassified Lentimicrobium]NPD46564.1 MmcQ/YjbR family DNA-binding protein [Lentimicrobium sp. S6]NPD85707.1 MmcQ/YjbR family DNA-binding protein [Lentimicrobium sp. L6]